MTIAQVYNHVNFTLPDALSLIIRQEAIYSIVCIIFCTAPDSVQHNCYFDEILIES